MKERAFFSEVCPARAQFIHFLHCLLYAHAGIYHTTMTHNFCIIIVCDYLRGDLWTRLHTH